MYVAEVDPPIAVPFKFHWYELPVLAVNVTLPPVQNVVVPPAVIAGVGKAFTVTAAVTVLVQLFEFVYVYVIVAVPALTPVTDPVDELTIAVAVFELDHVPPD